MDGYMKYIGTWNIVAAATPICHPEFPDVDIEEDNFLQPSHFELLYYHNYHYDTVVAVENGRVNIGVPIYQLVQQIVN